MSIPNLYNTRKKIWLHRSPSWRTHKFTDVTYGIRGYLQQCGWPQNSHTIRKLDLSVNGSSHNCIAGSSSTPHPDHKATTISAELHTSNLKVWEGMGRISGEGPVMSPSPSMKKCQSTSPILGRSLAGSHSFSDEDSGCYPRRTTFSYRCQDHTLERGNCLL